MTEVGRGLLGSEHVVWVGRLRADLDNVRAAVGWALERDAAEEQELALRILASLDEPSRGYPDMGIGTLGTQAVPTAEAASPELRVPVLSLAAFYEWNQGRTERAREIIDLARRDGVVPSVLQPFAPHSGAVVFEMAAGNHARALEIANETRAELGTVDNPYAQSSFLASIANFEAMAGEFEQARADAARALEIARRTRNIAVICGALHATAWALQRDDPAEALAAVEEYLDLYREYGVGIGTTSSVLALAGGLRARLRNDAGALELLHEAVIVARDHGVRPQFASALDWSLSPLFRTGRPEVAATFLGALADGALADGGNFPLVASNRARSTERARSMLGDQTNHHIARGAAMSYDELAEYAIQELESD
jgi:tetratricopeptide (TPR) repeat protein